MVGSTGRIPGGWFRRFRIRGWLVYTAFFRYATLPLHFFIGWLFLLTFVDGSHYTTYARDGGFTYYCTTTLVHPFLPRTIPPHAPTSLRAAHRTAHRVGYSALVGVVHRQTTALRYLPVPPPAATHRPHHYRRSTTHRYYYRTPPYCTTLRMTFLPLRTAAHTYTLLVKNVGRFTTTTGHWTSLFGWFFDLDNSAAHFRLVLTALDGVDHTGSFWLGRCHALLLHLWTRRTWQHAPVGSPYPRTHYARSAACALYTTRLPPLPLHPAHCTTARVHFHYRSRAYTHSAHYTATATNATSPCLDTGSPACSCACTTSGFTLHALLPRTAAHTCTGHMTYWLRTTYTHIPATHAACYRVHRCLHLARCYLRALSSGTLLLPFWFR